MEVVQGEVLTGVEDTEPAGNRADRGAGGGRLELLRGGGAPASRRRRGTVKRVRLGEGMHVVAAPSSGDAQARWTGAAKERRRLGLQRTAGGGAARGKDGARRRRKE